MNQRYFDFNATCPMLPVAIEAYSDCARQCGGNPSSMHWAGREARRALDDARDVVATYFGVESGAVVFTSGGTESNNLALSGWLARQAPGKVISSMIEHPSVLRPLERWDQRDGWQVTLLRPNHDGVIAASKVAAALDEGVRLVSIMAANNETGVIQPLGEIAALCQQAGVALHVDGVQALGKLEVKKLAAEADFLSFSGHKIGGARGVGGLLVKRGRQLQEQEPGGGQERKRRSGTENVAGICSLAAALGVIDFVAMAPLRDLFENSLLAALPDAVVIGVDAPRTPNTSLFSIPGLEGETVLMQLDLAGFAVASGSACSSGQRRPSHVLMAMGLSPAQARGSIRVSFGSEHDGSDVEALVAALVQVRVRLQAMGGR
ncbi:MAG: cysteine desulfurase family protein [Mariprofundales bacterium]|nr:cysteine desulfurase family protein [Mariprofundales bacterium]